MALKCRDNLCVAQDNLFSLVIQPVVIMNRKSATAQMRARNSVSDSKKGEVSVTIVSLLYAN